MKNTKSLVIPALAACVLAGFVSCGDKDPEPDPIRIGTSAYFAPDTDNPERSLVPSPNVLVLDTSVSPPTLSLKPGTCFEPGSATETFLDALEGLSGFGTYSLGNIQAYFGRQLEEASLSGRVVMLDLGTFGRDGENAKLEHPVPLSLQMTTTPKFLAGCSSSPEMVPTLVSVPFDEDKGLPVVLEPNHQYALAVLEGVLDSEGYPVLPYYIWTMVRVSEPILPDPSDPSSYESLCALAQLQAVHRPVLDAFEVAGMGREEILVAWSFNTEPVHEPMEHIVSQLGTLGTAYDSTDVVVPATAESTVLQLPPLPPQQFLGAMGLSCVDIGSLDDCAGIGTLLTGEFVSPNFQQEVDIPPPYVMVPGGNNSVPGTFDSHVAPGVQGTAGRKLAFLASTPAGADGPYPVVIFQHPITPTDPAEASQANKLAVLGLANNLGHAGIGTVAIDGVLAGDRAVLVENVASVSVQLYPVLNTDILVTRDNLRQTVVDLLQLVRVLKACTPATCGGLDPDPERIMFVGTSLGSVTGTGLLVYAPGIERAVLNTPAGGLVDTLANSPVLSRELIPSLCAGGLMTAACCSTDPATCTPQDLTGDPGFGTFRVSAQWMIDPADPVNHTARLAARIAGGELRLLIQAAGSDQVFPGAQTDLLAGLLGLMPGETYKTYDPGQDCGQPGQAHTMLLKNCGQGTAMMHTDLITFLASP